MSDETDYPQTQGAAAIGGRLRRLSERIDRDATRIYAEAGQEFEQRWFGVLNQLVLQGPLSVGSAAATLGITHVSISQTRSSLEAAGLIERRPDPNDGRSSKMVLTRKGQQLAKRLAPVWEALNAVAVELDTEAGNVVAALDRLDAALDRKSLYERAKEKLGEPELKPALRVRRSR